MKEDIMDNFRQYVSEVADIHHLLRVVCGKAVPFSNRCNKSIKKGNSPV
jgi:hypothetical protein